MPDESEASPEEQTCPNCGHLSVLVLPGKPGQRDGRDLGDWATRYSDSGARRAIRVEATYIAIAQAICVAMTLTLLVDYDWIPGVSSSDATSFGSFALAYLGGFFGGTMFAMKWLYHSVARGIWNLDRRLWRVYTPFLSGGSALALVLLSATGVVPIFGPEVMKTPSAVVGISIVLGYFSDRVFSALEGFAKQNLSAKTSTDSR